MTAQVIKEFGREPVTIEPFDGVPYPVPGIFGELSREVDPGGVLITSSRPNLFLSRGDLKRLPTNRDHFVVRGERFRVIDVHLDEEGGVTVELSR